MLVVKAESVALVLTGGRRIAARGAMMHDESGAAWPRCSVLVGPYRGGPPATSTPGSARRYLGSTWNVRLGSTNLPARGGAEQAAPMGPIVGTILGTLVGGVAAAAISPSSRWGWVLGAGAGALVGLMVGSAVAPPPLPRKIEGWSRVGEAERIYYRRHGGIYGHQLFKHDFKRPVGVWRKGGFTRIELGAGCTLNWRGFIYP